LEKGLEARAEITDFWAMVFNPSSMDRLFHVWIGALLAGAFLVLSVHAYYLLKGRYIAISKKAFKIALTVATVLSLSQLLSGHQSAHGVTENQPAKLAAFEGHYAANEPADMYIFGWVDEENEKVYGVKVPGGLSFLVAFDSSTKLPGLKAFPADEVPSQVNAVFQLYHLMVSIGIALIALTLYATFLRFRGRLFSKKWLLTVFAFSVLLPQVANQVGWFAAEMGRQPWVVYGLLRTSDALSKSVNANQVLSSLIMFFIIYTILFLLFLYLLNKKNHERPI
jgi:cytochrome d ubiquinol oxidase subunit I